MNLFLLVIRSPLLLWNQYLHLMYWCLLPRQLVHPLLPLIPLFPPSPAMLMHPSLCLLKVISWLFLEFPTISPTVLIRIFILYIKNTRLMYRLAKPSQYVFQMVPGLGRNYLVLILLRFFFQSPCGSYATSLHSQKF